MFLIIKNIITKIIRFIFSFIWTITIVLYSISIIASYYGTGILASLSILATIFNVLLVAMIFVLLDTIRKKNKFFIAVSSFLLLISWGLIRSTCPINFNSKDNIKDTDLKLLSYNVNVFRLDPRSEEMPSAILDYIAKEDLDIVCFQEAVFQSTEQNGLTIRELKKVLAKKYPYSRLDRAQVDRGSGLMILSKYPIKKAENINMNSMVNGAMAYHLDIKGKDVLLINTHLESFKIRLPFLSRDEAIDNIGKTSKAISKINLFSAYKKRSKQAEVIVDYIEKNAVDGRAILMGDLNDTPTSYTAQKIGSVLDNAFTKSGTGLGISFAANIFYVRIDAIFASKDFKPIYTEVLSDIKYSDHYPIKAVYRIENL